jgi:hypothetical protein
VLLLGLHLRLQRQTQPPSCTVTVDITADMTPPIFVYYELDGVYQNHRRCVWVCGCVGV